MTTATDSMTAIRMLAERYGEAWNRQDLDAIMDLHTEDSVFVAHAVGTPRPRARRPSARRSPATWPSFPTSTSPSARCMWAMTTGCSSRR